ncbi:hypothetical protein QUQ58_004885 [Escherichia coli]|nr:hypothetical protein [Escherichia coli]
MTQNILTAQEKAIADKLAMERVYAMNSDEYLLQVVDAKVHRLEAHVKAYFEQRLAFHCSK